MVAYHFFCLYSCCDFICHTLSVISASHKTYFSGILGYNSFSEFEQEQLEIAERNKIKNDKISQLAFSDIIADESLYTYAVNGGEALFQENCAPCHGQNGVGRREATLL